MLISNITEKNRQTRVLFFLLFSLNDLYASGYTNDFLQEIQRNICHTSTGTYLILLVQEITRGDVANENRKNWLFWPKVLDPKILGSKVKLSQVEIQVSAKFRGRVLKCRRNSWLNFTRPWDILFFVEIFGIFHFKIWDIQIGQILEYSIFHGISQNIPNFIWDIHSLGKSGI